MKRMIISSTSTDKYIDKIMDAYESGTVSGRRAQIINMLGLDYQANAYDVERTLKAADPAIVTRVCNKVCR